MAWQWEKAAPKFSNSFVSDEISARRPERDLTKEVSVGMCRIILANDQKEMRLRYEDMQIDSTIDVDR